MSSITRVYRHWQQKGPYFTEMNNVCYPAFQDPPEMWDKCRYTHPTIQLIQLKFNVPFWQQNIHDGGFTHGIQHVCGAWCAGKGVSWCMAQPWAVWYTYIVQLYSEVIRESLRWATQSNIHHKQMHLHWAAYHIFYFILFYPFYLFSIPNPSFIKKIILYSYFPSQLISKLLRGQYKMWIDIVVADYYLATIWHESQGLSQICFILNQCAKPFYDVGNMIQSSNKERGQFMHDHYIPLHEDQPLTPIAFLVHHHGHFFGTVFDYAFRIAYPEVSLIRHLFLIHPSRMVM